MTGRAGLAVLCCLILTACNKPGGGGEDGPPGLVNERPNPTATSESPDPGNASEIPGDGAEADDTPPRKVAVLVSAEYAETPDTPSDSDAWYDTVLMYCMLRENGFQDEDIYVMYGFGADGFYIEDRDPHVPVPADPKPSGQPPLRYYEPPFCDASTASGFGVNQITDFPMAYTNGAGKRDGRCLPQLLFDCLAGSCPSVPEGASSFAEAVEAIEPVEPDDLLFVWWRGHGTVLNGVLSLSLPAAEDISATEITASVAAIPAGRRLLLFETCHSGCVTDYLDTLNPPGVVMASSGCDESSTRDHEFDVIHGVWTYLLAGSFKGSFPNSGTNEIDLPDKSTIKVSLNLGGPADAAFDESSAATIALTEAYDDYKPQHPEIADDGGLAAHLRLDEAAPPGPAVIPTPTPSPDPNKT